MSESINTETAAAENKATETDTAGTAAAGKTDTEAAESEVFQTEELQNEGSEKEASIQNDYNSLKQMADKAMDNYHEKPYDVKDIIKDVIFFFVVIVIAYGWTLLMCLIFSFVTLGYIHFPFSRMQIISWIVTAIVGIVYIVSKIVKYNRLNFEKDEFKERKKKEKQK